MFVIIMYFLKFSLEIIPLGRLEQGRDTWIIYWFTIFEGSS